MLRFAIAAVFALSTACTGTLELELPPDLGGGSEPDPDTGSDPDPDPDPGDQPTPLALTEVQQAFDTALETALSGASSATVTDRRAEARIDGSVSAADATVTFEALVVTKAPFAIAGAATVTRRGQSARVAFAGGSPTGQVSAGGVPLGSIDAGFPALDDFAEDAVIELLGLVIECQGVNLGEAGGVLTFDGSCTVRDDAGQALGSATVSGVSIDLVTGSASGSIVVNAGGVVAEVRLLGATADLIVDGTVVGSVDLSALVAALL